MVISVVSIHFFVPCRLENHEAMRPRYSLTALQTQSHHDVLDQARCIPSLPQTIVWNIIYAAPLTVLAPFQLVNMSVPVLRRGGLSANPP